jgi:hypothetical protein
MYRSLTKLQGAEIIDSHWVQKVRKALIDYPIITVVAIYTAIIFAVYPANYQSLYFDNFFIFESFLIPFILVCMTVACIAAQPLAPFQALYRMFRERIRILIVGQVLFVCGQVAFTTYKINIPHFVPFYADPWLATIDNNLHGTVPWTMLYQGPGLLTDMVDFLYSKVWPVVYLSLFAHGLIFFDRRQLLRLSWMIFFCYAVLGNLVATVFSSVGPVFYNNFYAGGRYLDVLQRVFADGNLKDVILYSKYLLKNYHSSDAAFGTGISAFPSVHVAFAVLVAWSLTSFGRWPAAIGWAYALSIEFGSIYTGWHYGIDGYASAVLTSIAWILISSHYKLPLFPHRQSDRELVPSCS